MNNPFFLHVNNHANVESEKALHAKLSKVINNHCKLKITKQGKPSYTFAGLILGNEFHIGIAKCSPNDQFCKKIGRAKAYGRAKANSGVHVVHIPSIVLSENKTGKFFSETCRSILETL